MKEWQKVETPDIDFRVLGSKPSAQCSITFSLIRGQKKMGQELDPGDFLEAGHSHYAEGRFQDACSAFEKAVEAAQTDEDRSEAYLGWGNALSRLKRYDEAAEKYEKAIQIEEDFPQAYLCWGNALFRLNRFDEAIEKYEKATQIDEDYAAAYLNWGLALENLNRFDEALEKCEKAIQIDEDYAEAYVGLGNALALSSLERYDEAIENYHKAIQIKGDYADPYLGWGNVLVSLERYDEAAEKYEKATQIKEDFPQAYFSWGNVLVTLERYDEAIEKYEKATQIDKHYARAYVNWGNVLVTLERYDEAIEKYEKATQIKGDYAEAYLKWGNTLISLKRYEEAVEKCQKTRELDPYNPYPVHIMANLFDLRGMYQESWETWESARHVYQRAHKKQTDLSRTASFCRNYGNVLRGVFERLEEAETVYNEGLKLDPTDAGILAGLVELHLAKADKDPAQRGRHYWNAREACNKAEKELTGQLQQDENPDTRFELAQLFLPIGRHDDAEIHLLKALEQDEERAEIYKSLGVVRYRKEDFQKAAWYFAEAKRLEPDDLTARTNLAETYLRLNLKDKAEVVYKGILRTAPGNVEACIGLGEVYLTMGGDDEEMYDRSIRCFNNALKMADSRRGSKKLKRNDRADVLYSRAHAKVMFYEKSSLSTIDERVLREALEDFKECCRLDLDNHKAERAKEKLVKRLSFPLTGWFTDKVAPLVVFGLAAVVFILSQLNFFFRGQWNFYFGGTDKLIEGGGTYALLTFGSLIFMVAGLYLPHILRLKVGVIELEKKPVAQITSSVGLGITWEKKPVAETLTPVGLGPT